MEGNMTTAPSTDQQTTGDTSVTEEGRHVTGVAKEEAGNVAAEAKDQVSALVDEAKTQVSEQSGQQRDRLVQTLTTFSNDLDQMVERSERSGMAADLAREAARRARDLSQRLDGREPQQLLDDVRSFARRRPGTFLLGALAAGVVAGRLTRGARDSRSSSGSHSGTSDLLESGRRTDGVGESYPATGSMDPAWETHVDRADPLGTSSSTPTVVDVPATPISGTDPLDNDLSGDLPRERGSL